MTDLCILFCVLLLLLLFLLEREIHEPRVHLRKDALRSHCYYHYYKRASPHHSRSVLYRQKTCQSGISYENPRSRQCTARKG